MRNPIPHWLFVSALGVCIAGAACTANVHDNTVTIPNAQVTFNTSADTNNIHAGQAVPLTLSAQNVFLVDPSATPPPEHMSDAAHFAIFLDDDTSAPLLVTAQVNASVTIPATTAPGPHKLICQLQKHDDTPTTATFEMNITVTVATAP